MYLQYFCAIFVLTETGSKKCVILSQGISIVDIELNYIRVFLTFIIKILMDFIKLSKSM